MLSASSIGCGTIEFFLVITGVACSSGVGRFRVFSRGGGRCDDAGASVGGSMKARCSRARRDEGIGEAVADSAIFLAALARSGFGTTFG